MFTFEQQENLFLLIGKELKERIECFVIGGSAMLYYNAKESTKDIDLVFASEKEQIAVKKILEEMNFTVRNPQMLYFNKKNVPILMSRNEERLDLFYKKIICFELSETMKKRATKKYEYNNLIANIVSPEDIILLKCATERIGDRHDAKQLVDNYNINWYTIIDEAGHQSKLGEDLFVVYLYDFLGELKEDLKADIPLKVIREIRLIGEKAMIRLIKEKEKRK